MEFIIDSLYWKFRGGLLVNVFELCCKFFAGDYSSFTVCPVKMNGLGQDGGLELCKIEIRGRSALKPRNTQEQVWAAEAVFETGILNNI